jgi:PAS domain-containing protein
MFQSKLRENSSGSIPPMPGFWIWLAGGNVAPQSRQQLQLYFNPVDRQRLVHALKRKGILANYEVKLRRQDGKPVWVLANYRLTRDETDEPIMEGILVDHTHQKRLEEVLRRGRERFRNLSLHDNLTGLYNTRYLSQALDELFVQSRHSGKPFSLIFMDMDNFKRVVDTHGHLNGSQALREVARTIRSAMKKPCSACLRRGRVRRGVSRIRQGPGHVQSASHSHENETHHLSDRQRSGRAAERQLRWQTIRKTPRMSSAFWPGRQGPVPCQADGQGRHRHSWITRLQTGENA